jgi:flagella basal body P-ring formation protein FlgA
VPLEAGDITFREGALEGPLDRWRLSPAQVLGKSLTRPLAAGERIPRSFLISTPAIERGALVELRLTTGAVELRAPGRAEQAGSVGDRLPFRNLESGRRVMARLLDARRAEVVADGAGIGGRQK